MCASTTTSQPSKNAGSNSSPLEVIGVGTGRLEKHHLVGGGHLRVDDGRQRGVVDRDQFGAIRCGVTGLGEDDGDGLTDVADPVGGQHGLDDAVPESRPGRGKLKVGVRQHRHHAVDRQRLGGIDGAEFAVGDRRTDEDGVQRARQSVVDEVFGVGGAGGEEDRDPRPGPPGYRGCSSSPTLRVDHHARPPRGRRQDGKQWLRRPHYRTGIRALVAGPVRTVRQIRVKPTARRSAVQTTSLHRTLLSRQRPEATQTVSPNPHARYAPAQTHVAAADLPGSSTEARTLKMGVR